MTSIDTSSTVKPSQVRSFQQTSKVSSALPTTRVGSRVYVRSITLVNTNTSVPVSLDVDLPIETILYNVSRHRNRVLGARKAMRARGIAPKVHKKKHIVISCRDYKKLQRQVDHTKERSKKVETRANNRRQKAVELVRLKPAKYEAIVAIKSTSSIAPTSDSCVTAYLRALEADNPIHVTKPDQNTIHLNSFTSSDAENMNSRNKKQKTSATKDITSSSSLPLASLPPASLPPASLLPASPLPAVTQRSLSSLRPASLLPAVTQRSLSSLLPASLPPVTHRSPLIGSRAAVVAVPSSSMKKKRGIITIESVESSQY